MFKINVSGVVAKVLLFSAIVSSMIVCLEAQSTNMYVINPDTGSGNFTFSFNNATVGTRFNATIWVYDYVGVFAYQVYLNVNDSLLNITRAWLAEWDADWIFADVSHVPSEPTFYDFDADGYMETVRLGALVLIGDPVTAATGLLGIVEFEIIYVPSEGASCDLNIDYEDTHLLDFDLNVIPVTKHGGHYQFFPGEVGWIDGSVEEEGTGLPIEGATVTANGLYDKTDASGYYRILIPPGTYNVTAEKIFYYNSTAVGVLVLVNTTTTQDFSLKSVVNVEWKPTCPYPYVPSEETRTNEPVLLTVNVTEPATASTVTSVQLSYMVNDGEWWNTSMKLNATAGFWLVTIPGHPGNMTVEFFIELIDNIGKCWSSSLYNYAVKSLLEGDINGNDKVDIWDVAYVAKHYGAIRQDP